LPTSIPLLGSGLVGLAGGGLERDSLFSLTDIQGRVKLGPAFFIFPRVTILPAINPNHYGVTIFRYLCKESCHPYPFR
jgi:hypothetical protein